MSLDRRLAIISLIPREPRSITTQEVLDKLNNEMGIESRLRTVQRDLLELYDVPTLGLRYYEGEERTRPPQSLDDEDQGGRKPSNQIKRWYISRVVSGLEIPSMDPSAATVLKLAERYLKGLLPAAVLENIDLYLKRATAVLEKPGRPREWLDSVAMVPKALPLLPPKERPEVANAVFQAIKNNHQLEVSSYTRNSPDTPKDYVINPLGIVLRDSSTYLVWTAVGDPEERLKEFVLHRIVAAKELETMRDIPVGFDLARFIHDQQGFGYLVKDEPEDIQLVLEVEPTLDFTLSETALSADQVIEPIDDQRFRVTATVKNTHQLRAWIREKGTQATVIAPEFVRKDLLEQYTRLIARYGLP